VLEMGEYEGGSGDIADLARWLGDMLEHLPALVSSAKPRSPRHCIDRSNMLIVRLLVCGAWASESNKSWTIRCLVCLPYGRWCVGIWNEWYDAAGVTSSVRLVRLNDRAGRVGREWRCSSFL